MRCNGWFAGAVLIVSLAACDKSSSQATPTASSTNATPVTASVAPSASAGPSAVASARAGAGATAWAGKYKSEKGTLYYPTETAKGDQWKKLSEWQGDDKGGAMGEGTLHLEVADDGRVTGEIDAPLGPATINGMLVDGALSARIDRKDPNDRGMTGTALGKMQGDKLDGTMRMSLPEASAFRSVTFSVAKM